MWELGCSYCDQLARASARKTKRRHSAFPTAQRPVSADTHARGSDAARKAQREQHDLLKDAAWALGAMEALTSAACPVCEAPCDQAKEDLVTLVRACGMQRSQDIVGLRSLWP